MSDKLSLGQIGGRLMHQAKAAIEGDGSLPANIRFQENVVEIGDVSLPLNAVNDLRQAFQSASNAPAQLLARALDAVQNIWHHHGVDSAKCTAHQIAVPVRG